jgi:hypothetical protein
MLLLPEGQTGEAWETSEINVFSEIEDGGVGWGGGIGQDCALTFSCFRDKYVAITCPQLSSTQYFQGKDERTKPCNLQKTVTLSGKSGH